MTTHTLTGHPSAGGSFGPVMPHFRRKAPRRRNKGMTVVEVMVASFLGVLLIGGIYSGIVQAHTATYASAQYIAAFNIGKELLEQMRGDEFAAVTPANYPVTTNILTHLGGSARVPIYCLRTNAIASAINPVRKPVTVTVLWTFRGKTLEQTAYGVIYKK